MAPPRKHGRRSKRRRHLVDVSTITSPASDPEPRGLDREVATFDEPLEDWANGRTFSGEGRVAYEIGPDEYEEYRRLLNEQSPSISVDDANGRNPAEVADGFDARSDQGQRGQPIDPFFDALRAEPGHRGPVRGGHAGGSAALDGVPTLPRSRSGRARARSIALVVCATLMLVAGAYVIFAAHSPTRPHASELTGPTRSAGIADLGGFASTLSAVHQAAAHAARLAGDHERTALAQSRARRAKREREVQQRKRERRQADANASRAHSQPSESPSTSSTASQDPTVTTTASSPPPSTATSSTGSTSGTTSSTTTHSHAFGDGGVLGAGHAG